MKTVAWMRPTASSIPNTRNAPVGQHRQLVVDHALQQDVPAKMLPYNRMPRRWPDDKGQDLQEADQDEDHDHHLPEESDHVALRPKTCTMKPTGHAPARPRQTSRRRRLPPGEGGVEVGVGRSQQRQVHYEAPAIQMPPAEEVDPGEQPKPVRQQDVEEKRAQQPEVFFVSRSPIVCAIKS